MGGLHSPHLRSEERLVEAGHDVGLVLRVGCCEGLADVALELVASFVAGRLTVSSTAAPLVVDGLPNRSRGGHQRRCQGWQSHHGVTQVPKAQPSNGTPLTEERSLLVGR